MFEARLQEDEEWDRVSGEPETALEVAEDYADINMATLGDVIEVREIYEFQVTRLDDGGDEPDTYELKPYDPNRVIEQPIKNFFIIAGSADCKNLIIILDEDEEPLLFETREQAVGVAENNCLCVVNGYQVVERTV